MPARCLSVLRWLVSVALMLLFVAAYLKVLLSPVWVSSTRLLLVEPTERFTQLQRGWPAVFEQRNTINTRPTPFALTVNLLDGKQFYSALALDVAIGIGLTLLVGLLIRRCLWRPNPWRFSLRTLLFFATFVALACGWWFYNVHTRLDEEKGIATLRASQLQFDAEYDYAGPGWLQRLCSPTLSASGSITNVPTLNLSSTVTRAHKGSAKSTFWPDERLDMFWRILAIRIQGPIADAQGLNLAAALSKFTQLRRIGIEKLPKHLSIEILQSLSNCKSLEQLKLSETDVFSARIAALGPLPKLRLLDLNMASHIDDAATDAICKMPALEIVLLTGTQVTDAGARRLLELPSLRRVALPFRISDKVVEEFVQRGVVVE